MPSLCKKTGKKLSVLARLSNLMSIKQRRISQFGCCPLIWMFHVKGVNNNTNHLHERSLRIVFQDNNSSFKDLLKQNSCTVYHGNNQSFAIEFFGKENVKNGNLKSTTVIFLDLKSVI